MRHRWIAVAWLGLLLGGPVLAGDKLNLNTATKEQLLAVGLTEGQALQVIAHRQKNGPFLQVEELLAVAQVNKQTFEKIHDRVTVDE
jgi:competence ComEA-like helix-hairpin-helix protein